MSYRDIIGHWKITANGSPGSLDVWWNGNTWNGRLWFKDLRGWEDLTDIALDGQTSVLQFTRSNQNYTGSLQGDELIGTFIQTGDAQVYHWNAIRASSPLAELGGCMPKVNFVATRSAAPDARIVLVLVEERLLGAMLATSSGGSSPLQRFLDDLQSEGWESFAFTYDVRSQETGERGHRHLPAEVLLLYRFIRSFYHASGEGLAGVILLGDFPAAGTCSFEDRPAANGPDEQHELDYFGVDAMLSDPFGYWEWLALAPMVSPGSLKSLRLPSDENRHPTQDSHGNPVRGPLYFRDEWSAPGFVHTRQWEVHHSQRNPSHYGAEPKYWIGRITASQGAWRTGATGWEYSEEEEVRLLTDYFNRNHAHRSGSEIASGLIFITDGNLIGWQSERAKMAAVIPNIRINADDPNLPAGNTASITNYISSYQAEYSICEFVMHSDWLNHYFVDGENQYPDGFPTEFSSEGSAFNVPLLPANTVKASHIIATPNKAAKSRFYLLGGCDVAAILHRPQFMIDGEHISPATPLSRQYGAQVLGVAYLIHGNGLAVLAHNVTNPVGDYTPIYNAFAQNGTFGDGVMALLIAENDAKLPYYRNVVFGDPTLRLAY